MSPEQMRAAIIKSYPSVKWAKRVSTMSDSQVAAVYQRLLNSKKL